MIAIGRYLVFILSVTGTILSNDKFTDEETGEFLQEIFRLHNVYRKKHGVKPLEFDKTLSIKSGELLHNISTGGTSNVDEKYGYNFIYLPYNEVINLDDNLANKIVSSWYDKGNNYDYKNEPTDISPEKFTQIVWAKTERMGLAMAIHEEIEHYAILVYYDPPGNQKGEYRNNVFRPQS